MFMRLVQLKIGEGLIDPFQHFYQDRVVSELQKLPGCLFATLIQSNSEENEFSSFTMWKTKADAEYYESSGLYDNLIDETRPYLAESSEWKIELSATQQIEYKHLPEEPVLKQYNVEAEEHMERSAPADTDRTYLRIVGLKLLDGKEEEFKTLYKGEILPALRETKGCRYAYLTHNLSEDREYISVTAWDDKKYADDYETGGKFEELVKRVQHTLSYLYQWKMALEKESGKKMITSEDLSVGHYDVVFGKEFVGA